MLHRSDLDHIVNTIYHNAISSKGSSIFHRMCFVMIQYVRVDVSVLDRVVKIGMGKRLLSSSHVFVVVPFISYMIGDATSLSGRIFFWFPLNTNVNTSNPK